MTFREALQQIEEKSNHMGVINCCKSNIEITIRLDGDFNTEELMAIVIEMDRVHKEGYGKLING
jgi:hypothetical protein